MKYKIKNDIKINSIKDYLRYYGIEKTSSFLNKPDNEDEIDPFLLENMEKCIDTLDDIFSKKKKIFLQVDSDADGFTSSAIFYSYFKNYYKDVNITYRLHDGKEHGVILDSVPADCDVIILPDSGSMQLKEQEELAKQGKIIIILDHHTVTDTFDNENVIIVNNQISPEFSNKYLSGAGIVLKTIQAHNMKYSPYFLTYHNYYDLAALGILSDNMDCRNLDNNYIVYQGLNNIKNKMIQGLIRQQEYSIKDITHLSKIDTVFYLSPLINGVIRAGTDEEKELLFRGFIEEPTQNEFTTEYRGQFKKEDYYKFVARTSYNIKNRQNTIKAKAFNILLDKINKENLNKNKAIVLALNETESENVPKNLTGLIAMELLKHFNKPAVLMRKTNIDGKDVYAGSCRGFKVDNFNSFIEVVRSNKNSDYAEGHAMAFGIQVEIDKLESFVNELNTQLQDIDFGSNTIEVDAIYTNEVIDKKLLEEYARYNFVFGNGIPEPKFAFKLILNSNNISIIGKDYSTLKINYNNISFIKFKDKKLIESLILNGIMEITLIGRPQINTFLGKDNLQILIEEIEVNKLTKSLF